MRGPVGGSHPVGGRRGFIVQNCGSVKMSVGSELEGAALGREVFPFHTVVLDPHSSS
jgi:hypothetical protein